MSLELLVLLAVFALLPLIQQLLEAARQRAPGTPERAGRPPLPTSQAPAHAPPPPTLAIPPLPEMAPDAMTASGRTPGQDAGSPVTLALTPHRNARRRTAVVGLGNRLDLRRAIVLTAILGPCRAVNPYDWPERAGRQ